MSDVRVREILRRRRGAGIEHGADPQLRYGITKLKRPCEVRDLFQEVHRDKRPGPSSRFRYREVAI
jgi:hypothetical protein